MARRERDAGARAARPTTRRAAAPSSSRPRSRPGCSTFATTFLLGRAPRAADFGRFTELLRLRAAARRARRARAANLASRALVAGTHSLRALARARLAGCPRSSGAARPRGAPGGAGRSRARPGRATPLDGSALGAARRCGSRSPAGASSGRRAALPRRAAARGARCCCCAAAGSGWRPRRWRSRPAPACAAWPRARALAAAGARVRRVLLRRRPEPHPAAERRPLAVLRESAPLAVHGGLLLLSPRVEFLVLTGSLSAARAVGLVRRGAAVRLVRWRWCRARSSAGAMPALTREALHGGERGPAPHGGDGRCCSRRRPPSASRSSRRPSCACSLGTPAIASSRGLLRLMAASLPAMFLNALVAGGADRGRPRRLAAAAHRGARRARLRARVRARAAIRRGRGGGRPRLRGVGAARGRLARLPSRRVPGAAAAPLGWAPGGVHRRWHSPCRRARQPAAGIAARPR